MIITMMADRYGYHSAVEEVREEWLEELLIFLGMDIQEIEDLSDPDFVEFLLTNKVEIIDFPSIGALRVEFEGDVVGEWAGPELTLERDEEDGGYYYKIEIECWTIREEDIDLSS